jgi:hypothetical protein
LVTVHAYTNVFIRVGKTDHGVLTQPNFNGYPREAKNLLAIFGGYLHFSYKALLPSGSFEYVTAAEYEGYCRHITLEPV